MSESPKERKVKKRAWSTYNFKADFALLMEDQNGLEPKKKKTRVHKQCIPYKEIGAKIMWGSKLFSKIQNVFLRTLCRRRGRLYEATKASLSSCNTTDTGGHLTQLITESVKASIHALKLHHNCLKSHTTTRRRRSGGGWNRGGWRIRHLGLWLLRSKLGLALSNRRRVNGTYDRKERRLKNRDRKMANDLHDSRGKNELITCHRIPIDIYK